MRLCFVLLPDVAQLTARKLEKACQEFPGLGKVKWGSTKKGVSTFKVGGFEVMAALMPAPVPDGEADHATERSLSGLDGTWTLPEHRAHLVVVQQGVKKDSLETLTAFTRAVAAIVRATNAVGVYWGDASATHHPEFVVNIAQSELPLPLWVGVSVAQGTGKKKGVELLSVGLQQFALPELLMRGSAADGDTLEFFYGLLAYVVNRGEAIPEGETVGRTEKEKLEVKTAKSPIDPSAKVWVVQLPAAKKQKRS